MEKSSGGGRVARLIREIDDRETNMKLTLVAAAALLSTSMAHAVLVEDTPTPFGTPANPSPRFGTLISFDDVATGSALVANHCAGVGVTSIANTLGPALGY